MQFEEQNSKTASPQPDCSSSQPDNTSCDDRPLPNSNSLNFQSSQPYLNFSGDSPSQQIKKPIRDLPLLVSADSTSEPSQPYLNDPGFSSSPQNHRLSNANDSEVNHSQKNFCINLENRPLPNPNRCNSKTSQVYLNDPNPTYENHTEFISSKKNKFIHKNRTFSSSDDLFSQSREPSVNRSFKQHPLHKNSSDSDYDVNTHQMDYVLPNIHERNIGGNFFNLLKRDLRSRNKAIRNTNTKQ